MTNGRLDDTGERMVPEFHQGLLIYAEHLQRYTAASEIVRNAVVLDIASGSGYGSALLAVTAARVIGVDVSADAVAYAQARFVRPNLEYRVGTATAIPLDDASVDVVITYETIEHVADYSAFVDEIRRVLRPEGIAIISTPNDLEFAEGNHFHLHEFEREEFRSLIGTRFPHVQEYYQATWKFVALGRMTDLQSERLDAPSQNHAPLSEAEALYFYFLCSARRITEEIPLTSAVGEHYSDRALVADAARWQAALAASEDATRRAREEVEQLHRVVAEIHSSTSWRVTAPLRGLGRFRRSG